MSQSFAIEARLSSPLIAHGFLTLDALLYFVMERMGLAHEDIFGRMPLDRHACGVFAGSAGFFDHTPTYGDTAFVGVGARNIEMAPIATGRGGRIAKLNVKSGKYKNIRNAYVTESADAMLWFGHGDLSATLALLSALDGVGKKASAGFGQVESWNGVPLASDYSLLFKNGEPSRPVPSGICDQGRLQASALLPPYYSGGNVLCRVPSTRIAVRRVHFD